MLIQLSKLHLKLFAVPEKSNPAQLPSERGV